MKKLLAPSLLSADFGKLYEEIQLLNNSDADWIHCDIMDGVFVPNLSFGFPVLHEIKQYTKKPLDVHLMIVEPEKYISRFKEAGAYILTVHYEACTHLHSVVREIKNNGMLAGVSVNPHTPVSLLEDIVNELDLILIMSVNPGFGGQAFIEHSVTKIKKLKELCTRVNASPLIEVDGGVDLSNAKSLYDAGADVLVSGTTIFKADNPKQMIIDLKNA